MSVPSGAAPAAEPVHRPPRRGKRRTGVAAVAAIALVSAAASIAPANASIQPGPKPTLIKPDSGFQGKAPVNEPLAKAPVPAKYPQVAAKPYMGWSSWSLQSTNYPGYNLEGGGSFINEKNILTQANALATK
ncbi:MAG: hypothetical protein QOG10_608, partial [Kribbellaceae bacterium]|nr:hypothetical protein [Kribbellaceae bacterium]